MLSLIQLVCVLLPLDPTTMESQKPSSVRSRKVSKKPNPGEESSDSARSRSLSAGRSSSRHGDSTRNSAKTESKWLKNKSKPKKTNRISSSDGDDDFTDSVSKRVKERRLRRQRQAQAQSQNAPQSQEKSASQAVGELGPPEIFTWKGTPQGDPTPLSEDNGLFSSDSDSDLPVENLPEINTECEAHKRWLELENQRLEREARKNSQSQSQIMPQAQPKAGRGVYLPVVSVVRTPSKNPGLVRTHSEGEIKLPQVYDELRSYTENSSQFSEKPSGKNFSKLKEYSFASGSNTVAPADSSGVGEESGTALDFGRAPLDRSVARQEKSKPYRIPKIKAPSPTPEQVLCDIANASTNTFANT